jgi:hypothetical protein
MVHSSRRVHALGLAIFICLCLQGTAHHIRGIPHYSYSDSYPTAPMLEEMRETGNLSLRMTYYAIPGTKAVDLALYIKDRHTDKPFAGKVEYAVFGENEDPKNAHSVVAYMNKNNIYKAGWNYDVDGLYMVRVRIHQKSGVVEEVFRMQIGEVGLSWWYIGGSIIGVLALIVTVATIKKMQMAKSVAAEDSTVLETSTSSER